MQLSTIAELCLRVVTFNIGHIICLVIIHRHKLFFLFLLPTVILHKYFQIFLFFFHGYWGRNRINDVVEAMNIMLKLQNGVLVLLNLTLVLCLPLMEVILQPPSQNHSPSPSHLSSLCKTIGLIPLLDGLHPLSMSGPCLCLGYVPICNNILHLSLEGSQHYMSVISVPKSFPRYTSQNGHLHLKPWFLLHMPLCPKVLGRLCVPHKMPHSLEQGRCAKDTQERLIPFRWVIRCHLQQNGATLVRTTL